MPPHRDPFRGFLSFVKNPINTIRNIGSNNPNVNEQEVGHGGDENNEENGLDGMATGGGDANKLHGDEVLSRGVMNSRNSISGTGPTGRNHGQYPSQNVSSSADGGAGGMYNNNNNDTTSPVRVLNPSRRISVEGMDNLSVDELLQKIAILQSEVESQRIRADFYEDSYKEEKRQREFLETLNRGGSKLSSFFRFITRPCRSCLNKTTQGPTQMSSSTSNNTMMMNSGNTFDNNNTRFQPINALDMGHQQNMTIV
jgi:uncharacterized small protein (DUF1192 family)